GDQPHRRPPVFPRGSEVTLVMTADAVIHSAVAAHKASVLRRVAAFGSHNFLFVIGGMILSMVLLVAILASWIAPYDPTEILFSDKLQPPSAHHLMGTNELGQDIFSQVVFGARISLMVGVIVVSVAMAIGVPLGLIAGYFGGHLDTALMRVADVFL